MRRCTETSRCGYSAFSLDAQMWVLATLIQLGTQSFERFVGPLTQADRESHYHDMRIFGTFFGLPVDYGPQTWGNFPPTMRRWYTGQCWPAYRSAESWQIMWRSRAGRDFYAQHGQSRV